MKVAVKVEGLKELDRALGELQEDMRGKALYSALHFAANPMLKEAKARAAQAPEPHQMQYVGNTVTVKPRLLKSAIKKLRLTKKEHAQGMYSAAIGIVISKKNPQKLYPRYWHFIERGTKKMPATPFLRPAFDNNKDEAVRRFKNKLGERIDKFK